jgi:glutamate transport system permease protein
VELVFEHFDLYLSAFRLTIGLFLVSGAASLVLGTLLAAMRVGPVGVLAKSAATYITVVRNTPLLMIFIFAAIALPELGVTFRSVESIGINSFFFRGCLALSLYTCTFVAEAVRSGINAVPVGQAEAARAIGLTFGGTMTQVVLPQAFRATVPPLASVMIALLKNSSVGAVFGLLEATARMKYFTNQTARDEPVFLLFALGYIVLVEAISFGANRLERRWQVAR